MKKQFNFFISIVTAAALMPQALTVKAADEDLQIALEYTASIFKNEGNAKRNTEYPTHMFNAANLPENYNVSLDGYNFELGGDFAVSDNNDCVKVAKGETVTVNISDVGESLKEIAFLGGAYTDNAVCDVSINFVNGAVKKAEKVKFVKMTEAAETSFDMGTEMVLKKSGVRVLFAEGTQNVYLNLIKVPTESISAVSSVSFENADNDIFIAAACAKIYSDADLENSIELVINELWEEYKDKTFLDLNEKNINDAVKLYENLVSAKEKNLSCADEDKLEYAKNLKDGYYLEKDAAKMKKDIEDIAGKYLENGKFIKPYEEEENIDGTIADLNKLLSDLKEYDNNKEKREELEKIAQFFSVPVDVMVEEYDRVMIEEYVEKLELKKYIDEAEDLYLKYADKNIGDIKTEDLENLERLLELYDKISEKGGNVEEEKRRQIAYLHDNFDAYQNSEVPYTVDLERYFTNDLIAYSGEQIDPETWVSAGDQNNVRAEDIKRQLTDGKKYVDEQLVTEENGEYKFYDTGEVIPFAFSEESLKAKALDAIRLGNKSGNLKSIVITPKQKRTENVYMLIYPDQGCILDAKLIYDDNSEKSVSIPVARGRSAGDLKSNPYSAGFWYIGGWQKNKLDTATNTVVAVPGEPHLNLLKIPAQTDKKIAKIVLEYSSSMQSSLYIYAVTEMPMKNDALIENTLKLYNELVKDTEIDSSDREKMKNFSAYYSEACERGLKISAIDKDAAESIAKMVLSISADMYRYDKNTVKVKVNFSVPVLKNTLNPIFKIDGEEKEVSWELSNDAKTLSADWSVDKFGGKTLTVEIERGLAIEEYPNITLQNTYTSELELDDYIGFERSQDSITLKNNSKVSQKYDLFFGIRNKGKIYTVSKISDEILSGEKKEHNINLEKNLEIIKSTDSGAEIFVFAADTEMSALCEITGTVNCGTPSTEGANYMEPSLNIETGELTVSGFCEPGSAQTAVYDDNGKLLYAGSVYTADDGYFSFTYETDREKITKSGFLTIELGAKGFEQKYVNKSIYLATDKDCFDILNILSNAELAEAIEKAADDITKTLALNFKPYTELMKDGKTAFCKRLYDVKDTFPKVASGDKEIAKKAAEAQRIIKQQAFLEALKNKKSELVFDGSFMAHGSVMNYNSIDENGVTLYSLYNNAVSEKGRDEINNSLLGGDYKDTAAFKKDFLKAIMLGALRNPKMSGIGYISDILTKENADAAEIDISNYLKISDKSAINKEIASLNITSLAELEKFIKNYKDNPGGSDKPTGGNKGSSGGSTSGVVVTDTKTVGDKKDAEFSDVPTGHWAYDAICELYKKGIIAGKGDMRFMPDKKITRAEFVKMLCILNNAEVGGAEEVFSDVSRDDWYFEYVGAGVKYGWIQGVDAEHFAPDSYISRQDICTVLYRMGTTEKAEGAEFSDSADISEYAKEAVMSLTAKNILKGFPDGSFRPKESSTRAQAATLLYGFYKLGKK